MTWIELTWMFIMAAFVAGGFLFTIITHESLGLLFALFTLMGGMIAATINSQNTPYKITSQFETNPITTILTSDGLNVITDEYEHFRYTNYADIEKWKNGGKFYKTYSFKKVSFGVDGHKFELLIK